MKRVKRFVAILCLCSMLFGLTGCIELQETPPYIEVVADETVFEDKFYYGQLSETEKVAYREIYQGLMNQEETIHMRPIEAEAANEILHSVIYDFGNIFWTDGGATSYAYEETLFMKAYTTMQVNYTYEKDVREQREAQIEAVVEDVVKSVPDTYSEYEKVKYVYEYLVNHADYVEDSADNQNLYSALVNKQTVCAGYAKANQYLLNRLGVYCTYVTGKATVEGTTDAHAWNIVRCDGKYYYVDVTWADPLFAAEEQQQQMDEMIYDYLCCSENVLKETHVLDEGYDYPTCDSEDLDYYRMNRMFYNSADKKQLLQAMKNSINQKQESTIFKFADKDVYKAGTELLLNGLMSKAGEYLCDRYGLRQVQYYYVQYDSVNRFAVYWQYK